MRSIGTINHLANIINSSGLGKVKKIEGNGNDIDIEKGAISNCGGAYGAFEKARNLLVEEIIAISNLAQEHLEDVRAVQEKTYQIGKFGREVNSYLESRIIPKLMQGAAEMGAALKKEIDEIRFNSKKRAVSISRRRKLIAALGRRAADGQRGQKGKTGTDHVSNIA
ncbi:MAG: hypothetical protein MZV65_41635 [Chromatiales bacterium]|nr:hypothetical protein [Chromatiales bacterium]